MISLINTPTNGRTGMRALKARFAYLMIARRAATRLTRSGTVVGFDANRFRSQLADYRRSVDLAVADQYEPGAYRSGPTAASLSGRPPQ
ncbi:hypothetical protein [Rhizobium sp. Root1220]|uniref:hypothetical protein n=1 Tax=Rhizobium sp. Root1220 TaxID=1736432 RepID=UPI000700F411|nr:hypothetical protein [Rhizobium sp. Root1220]KQV70206.1 hypothetical protein ASC90_08725 [Rhizobium sp. Root1220]